MASYEKQNVAAGRRFIDVHVFPRAGTGKHAEWLGIGIYTVRDGRITEGWFAEDILGMLIQLDVLAVRA